MAVVDDVVCVLGLVAEGEKPQKQTAGLVVTKDLMGNTHTANNNQLLIDMYCSIQLSFTYCYNINIM